MRGGATIHLWRERDGDWRWAYRTSDVEITSNHPYPTEAAARAAAAIAYPGAQVSSEEAAAPSPVGQTPTRWTLLLMITAVWRWYRQARRPGADKVRSAQATPSADHRDSQLHTVRPASSPRGGSDTSPVS